MQRTTTWRLLHGLCLLAIAVATPCPTLAQDTDTTQAKQEDASDTPYARMLWHMYGRVGVDVSFQREGALGRTLNLNSMGSIGGRHEEGDYFELVPTWRLVPEKQPGELSVDVQFRFAIFSKQGQLASFISSGLIDDLAIVIGDAFVQVNNLFRPELNLWVGARYYRGPDIHIADYYYFNDLYGQGAGIQYRDTEAAILVVAPTDQPGTPQYVFNNLVSGDSVNVRRQRLMFTAQQRFRFGPEGRYLHVMGQYHFLPEGNEGDADPTLPDSLIFPADWGFVLGARFRTPLPFAGEGSHNDLAVRYGSRIANGSDGGNAFTWITYGAPALSDETYAGAYQWQLIDNFLLNVGRRFSLGGYGLYRPAHGGASSDHRAPTFDGRTVFNRKWDAGAGLRGIYYLTDFVHLMGEAHYAVRKNGTNPMGRVAKLSFIPTIMPLGRRAFFGRPHLRLVYTVAFYNEYARDNLMSPWLTNQGHPNRVGHYLGIKSEWWF